MRRQCSACQRKLCPAGIRSHMSLRLSLLQSNSLGDYKRTCEVVSRQLFTPLVSTLVAHPSLLSVCSSEQMKIHWLAFERKFLSCWRRSGDRRCRQVEEARGSKPESHERNVGGNSAVETEDQGTGMILRESREGHRELLKELVSRIARRAAFRSRWCITQRSSPLVTASAGAAARWPQEGNAFFHALVVFR